MKISAVLLCTIIIFFVSFYVEGSRILTTAPTGTKSHQTMYSLLMKELVNRGHHVTVITNYEMKEHKNETNVRQIVLHELAIDLTKVPRYFDSIFNPDYWEIIKSVFNAMVNVNKIGTEVTYRNPQVLNLIENETFDLVMISQGCIVIGYPLAWHFKAPMIVLAPNAIFAGTATALGDHEHYSHVPSMQTPFTNKMTVSQRAINLILGELFSYLVNYYHFSTVRTMVKQMNVIPGCPDIYEIEKNTSLVFTNSHPTFSYSRPLPPQIIEVGGMNVRPAKPLPTDLEEFVSSAGEAGFILFAIGSLIPMNEMPENVVQAFINTFARLPHRVVWQWQGKPRENLPENLLLVPWIPQQDLLGHANCKAFITHGGLNSMQEAIYHKVPVLGLPFSNDQFLNLNRAVNDGYAVKLYWTEVTEESVGAALDQLLHNSTYMDSVKRLSSIYRDQTETPLERAVYWTEFVIRHKGADHLRLGSRDLNFLQRSLIDVYLVLFAAAIIPLFFIVCCLRRCCCQRKKSSLKSTNQLSSISKKIQ